MSFSRSIIMILVIQTVLGKSVSSISNIKLAHKKTTECLLIKQTINKINSMNRLWSNKVSNVDFNNFLADKSNNPKLFYDINLQCNIRIDLFNEKFYYNYYYLKFVLEKYLSILKEKINSENQLLDGVYNDESLNICGLSYLVNNYDQRKENSNIEINFLQAIYESLVDKIDDCKFQLKQSFNDTFFELYDEINLLNLITENSLSSNPVALYNRVASSNKKSVNNDANNNGFIYLLKRTKVVLYIFIVFIVFFLIFIVIKIYLPFKREKQNEKYLNPYEIIKSNLKFESENFIDIENMKKIDHLQMHKEKQKKFYQNYGLNDSSCKPFILGIEDKDGDTRSEHSTTDSERMVYVQQWIDSISVFKFIRINSHHANAKNSEKNTIVDETLNTIEF